MNGNQTKPKFFVCHRLFEILLKMYFITNDYFCLQWLLLLFQFIFQNAYILQKCTSGKNGVIISLGLYSDY